LKSKVMPAGPDWVGLAAAGGYAALTGSAGFAAEVGAAASVVSAGVSVTLGAAASDSDMAHPVLTPKKYAPCIRAKNSRYQSGPVCRQPKRVPSITLRP